LIVEEEEQVVEFPWLLLSHFLALNVHERSSQWTPFVHGLMRPSVMERISPLGQLGPNKQGCSNVVYVGT
jgi:hypothetical protein